MPTFLYWPWVSAVFLMGFLGSWHCGAMCGPLSCNFRQKNDFLSYHLGRLISYLLVVVALFFGASYFLQTESRILKLSASLVFAIIFLIFGLVKLNIIKFKRFSFKYSIWQFKVLQKCKSLTDRFPFILGLLTGLFPCGWLYSFLLLASQMKSLQQACGLIFVFWLTGLPAFFIFTGVMRKLIQSSPVSYQKISGIVLILAGLLSILGHWSEVMSSYFL